MTLDPLGSFVKEVHLLELFLVLLHHDGEQLIALLLLLNARAVLVVNKVELMVGILEL